MRANIDRGPTVSRDDELGAFLGFLEDLAQVRQQLREQRHHPRFAAGMVFGLGASHSDSVALPIHVDPPQRQLFRGATQSAVPAQGEQKSPLGVGAAIQHALGLVFADEVHAAGIRKDVDLLARKRITLNQALAHRSVEELLGDAATATNRVVRQPGADERQSPLVNVAGRDLAQRLGRAEVLDEVPARVVVCDASRWLGIASAFNVRIEERLQSQVVALLQQSHRCQPLVHRVVEVRHPTCRLFFERRSGHRRREQMLDAEFQRIGSALRHFAKANRSTSAVGTDELDQPRAV